MYLARSCINFYNSFTHFCSPTAPPPLPAALHPSLSVIFCPAFNSLFCFIVAYTTSYPSTYISSTSNCSRGTPGGNATVRTAANEVSSTNTYHVRRRVPGIEEEHGRDERAARRMLRIKLGCAVRADRVAALCTRHIN